MKIFEVTLRLHTENLELVDVRPVLQEQWENTPSSEEGDTIEIVSVTQVTEEQTA